MGLKGLYTKFDRMAHRLSRARWQKGHTKHHYEILEKAGIPIKKLNSTQVELIRSMWGWKDISTHELFYSITGEFDVNICPESLFITKLEFLLNNQEFVTAWSDKNYFDKFFPDAKFPNSLVRNISGTFYDTEYNLISKEDAVRLLAKYKNVCIKPSLESGMGKGVKLVSVDENIGNIMDQYKSDYVIQEVLEQYEPIKKLNPSSVNIIRVCSLFINDSVSTVSASLRCGASGEFNDNSVTADGRGMFVIGMDSEGRLNDTAYYPCGERLNKAPNGVDFAGMQIPNFEEVKAITSAMHKKMPFAAFIGFDVAFDPDGKPIIMEYNLKAPGVFYYQLANGSLFGERTQEVINTFLCK